MSCLVKVPLYLLTFVRTNVELFNYSHVCFNECIPMRHQRVAKKYTCFNNLDREILRPLKNLLLLCQYK